MRITTAPAWVDAIRRCTSRAVSTHRTESVHGVTTWVHFAIGAAMSLSISACASAATPVASSSSGPQGIAVTSISLEQNCSSCAGSSSRLVLRRDGSAVLTVTGSARQGMADTVSTGHLAVADFATLVQFVMTQGFFELKDDYDDPELQDGTWSTISVFRGTNEKRVFRRNDSAPPPLKAIESAIADAKSRIVFKP